MVFLCIVRRRRFSFISVSDTYHPECEEGIRWDDPEVGIQWPVGQPILSDKDRVLPFLRDIPARRFAGEMRIFFDRS